MTEFSFLGELTLKYPSKKIHIDHIFLLNKLKSNSCQKENVVLIIGS